MDQQSSTFGFDRRSFLKASGAMIAGATVPSLAWTQPGAADPRTLIMVELKGGNDGLSTVIPIQNEVYGQVRNTALIAPHEALQLDATHGLNPELRLLNAAFVEGRAAIVEGVGLPNGVRSHFRATDIWHSADPEKGAARPGWIARLGEMAWKARGSDAVIHFGDNPLRSHFSPTRSPLAVRNPDHFAKLGRGPNAGAGKPKAPKRSRSEPKALDQKSALERIRRLAQAADYQSKRIRMATAGYRTKVEYPTSPLGQNMRDMCAMLNYPEGAKVRVLSTTFSGFDTHARQKRAHDRQMAGLDAALGALMADLGRTQAGRRAVVMVYSEFGRRVNENGSQGTDHGKAGPLFILGHEIQGGIYGQEPSLSDLDNGDLKVTTDFRAVYATLVEKLFDANSTKLFGESFETLDFLG